MRQFCKAMHLDPFTQLNIHFSDLVKRSLARHWAFQMPPISTVPPARNGECTIFWRHSQGGCQRQSIRTVDRPDSVRSGWIDADGGGPQQRGYGRLLAASAVAWARN
jgi:hypothetical protein